MNYEEFATLCHKSDYDAPTQAVYEGEIEKIYYSRASFTKEDIVYLYCCSTDAFNNLVTHYNRITRLSARLAACKAYEFHDLTQEVCRAIEEYRDLARKTVKSLHLFDA